MKRNKIIKHYKSFFGLEDMGLAENDHLMIDWAESLVKDCNLHIVNGSALMKALLNSQQEIISSPIRFNGVSNEDIKRIFAEHGIKYEQPF